MADFREVLRASRRVGYGGRVGVDPEVVLDVGDTVRYLEFDDGAVCLCVVGWLVGVEQRARRVK